jgi:hypothetical protein
MMPVGMEEVSNQEDCVSTLHHRKTTLTEGWGETGIDGVFKKDGQYYIVEAKYGTATLSPANQATGLPRQMSDAWIDRDIKNILGETLEQTLIDTRNYKRLLVEVSPDGSIIYKLINSDGYVITGNAGIFVP